MQQYLSVNSNFLNIKPRRSRTKTRNESRNSSRMRSNNPGEHLKNKFIENSANSNSFNTDEQNWLLTKSILVEGESPITKENEDFKMLKDLLFASFTTESHSSSSLNNLNDLITRQKQLSDSSSSLSSDNKEIEFLDENIMFEQDPNYIPKPRVKIFPKREQIEEAFIELEEEEPDIVNALIEEIDNELKNSNASSYCSSPAHTTQIGARPIKIVNNSAIISTCSCSIKCDCYCHLKRRHLVNSSNTSNSLSSSLNSNQNLSHLRAASRKGSQAKSNSFDSLEWDVSLDIKNEDSNEFDCNNNNNNNPKSKILRLFFCVIELKWNEFVEKA